MKEEKYPPLPGCCYYSAFDAPWSDSYHLNPPIFRIEMPHVGVALLTNDLKKLKLSLFDDLHIVIYEGSYNGVFFRFPHLTIIQSLLKVRKILKMLRYSSVKLLDVGTMCPNGYKNLVNNPEIFSTSDIRDLLCSRIKLLSYKQYLVWEKCRRQYYKYEREEHLKMTWRVVTN